MTKRAPDDKDELQSTATNPPDPYPDKQSGDTEPDSTDATPGVDDGKTPPQNGSNSGIGWHGLLPDNSDDDGDGRTGFLSTRKELHVTIAGIAAGIAAAAIGLPALAGVLGAVVGLDGINRLTNKVTEQMRHEPWYAIVGIAVGWVLATYAPNAAEKATEIIHSLPL